MGGLLKRLRERGAPKRGDRIGWFVLADDAGFIWSPPRPVTTDSGPPNSAKSVNLCPAVLDHEARIVEIPCPVDLELTLQRDERGTLHVQPLAGPQSTVNPGAWKKLLSMTPPQHWRRPNRPLLQVITPYRFLSDGLVYMNQLPAFLSYKAQHLPGLLIGGRFPIDAWPRPLMWAFEWHDTKAPISLKRGDPWFYLKFETVTPTSKPRLIQAAVTEDLVRFCRNVDSVTNYTNKTFSLLPFARSQKPKNLLVEFKN
ncbi:MAG: hypothetical protein AAF684_04190 [Pseudomonadota bacterium]